jgi:hypothetical protein
MKVEGWSNRQEKLDDDEKLYLAADLYPDPQAGKFSLRLEALPIPNTEPSNVLPGRLVEVSSPKLRVRGGDILHITGWVKIIEPVQGNPDGVVLYDSIGGPTAALRWFKKSDWKSFQMVREVPRSGEFQLRFVLNGMGVVQLDELRVIAHRAGGGGQARSDQPVRSPLTGEVPYSRLPAQPARSRLASDPQK